jgi:drug/metabolite transporter (DMT)-like permease
MVDRTGIVLALLSAFLFGASTPIAKLLLGTIDPWLLAGVLYLGSGTGLACLVALQRLRGVAPTEAKLTLYDLPWLAGAVLAGGCVGPVMLMVGLSRTPASTAALMLNLEGLATMAIAWLVFRENVNRRLLLGAAAILSGAVLLTWQGGPSEFGLGTLAIVGACLAWGIDNNLTRKLSASDPVQIAAIKGLVAGSINLTLAFIQGASAPVAAVLVGAGAIGFFGYGVSLVLFILALRHLGTARTGAYFSTSPFIGALLGVAIFSDAITAQLAVAAVLMVAGVWLHLTETHEHEHIHEAIAHEHAHLHDVHHQHVHCGSEPTGEPHSHMHTHARLRHSHPHYPDAHHRHAH